MHTKLFQAFQMTLKTCYLVLKCNLQNIKVQPSSKCPAEYIKVFTQNAL